MKQSFEVFFCLRKGFIMRDTAPLRVLHVVSIMNRAGLETMLMNYYRHIDHSKIQFDFLTHREEKGDYDDEIRQLGGRIYHAPAIGIRNLFLYDKEVTRFFKNHKREYQIVHSHLDALSAFPLKSAHSAGIPVRIAHSHTSNFPKDIKLPFRLLSKKMIPNYTTDYMGCSQEANQFMFGSRGENALILPNAIDAKLFAFDPEKREMMRKKLHLENQFVVGHIGRFDTAKNQAFVVDIFSHIHTTYPKSTLVMIGRGEKEPLVRDKVKKVGLEKDVCFLGNRGDVSDLLQSMDVFIFPSLFEGLGIVLLEAQAAGLHCLTSAQVVPQEAQITDLLEYVDLKVEAKVWADKALQYRTYCRKCVTEQVVKAGYDICDQAEWLQNYYLSKRI